MVFPRAAPFAAVIPGDSAVEQVLTTGFSSFLCDSLPLLNASVATAKLKMHVTAHSQKPCISIMRIC